MRGGSTGVEESEAGETRPHLLVELAGIRDGSAG